MGGEFLIDLRTLNSTYQPLSVRYLPLIVVPLVLLLVCTTAIWGLFKQSYIPDDALGYFYHWPIIGFLGSLFAVIRGIRRVEYFRFLTRSGKPAVDIIREKKQEAECTAFMLALVANIEIAQSDLQPEAKSHLLRNLVHDDAKAPAADLGPDRWIASILLGGFAVIIPLIPAVNYYIAEMVFPIVFLLSLGGLCFSVFSFVTREPKKWWSVIGFILSLIPPYFY